MLGHTVSRSDTHDGVIDTAKALAAVTGRGAAAIPTTLSAAEMTKVHRLPAGAKATGVVRPRVVINDPALSASQPDAELAASAANSGGHGLRGFDLLRDNELEDPDQVPEGAERMATMWSMIPDDRGRAASVGADGDRVAVGS